MALSFRKRVAIRNIKLSRILRAPTVMLIVLMTATAEGGSSSTTPSITQLPLSSAIRPTVRGPPPGLTGRQQFRELSTSFRDIPLVGVDESIWLRRAPFPSKTFASFSLKKKKRFIQASRYYRFFQPLE